MKNLVPDVLQIMKALPEDEWFHGFAVSEDGSTLLSDSQDPDSEYLEIIDDDAQLLMGGLISWIWSRWRHKKLRPHFGGSRIDCWISVFPAFDTGDDEMGSFPVYRATGTNDLECLIMAVQMELGLIEGR